MIRSTTNHRQPTIAADVFACLHVLNEVVAAIPGYSRSEAGEDFDRACHDGYGEDMSIILSERYLPHVSFVAGHPLDIDSLLNTYHLAHEQALLLFADPLPIELRRGRDVTPSHLESVIDTARQQGWDADRIADGVVLVESAHHHGLVLLGAGRIARNRPHPSDEYVSYGWIGLRTALLKFEPALGHRFSTYAVTKIIGAIRDGERDEDPLPKRLVTDRNKAARATAELSETLGRSPTLAELSAEIGEKLAGMLPRLSKSASLDELSDTFTLPDGTTDVERDAEVSALRTAVDEALSHLDPQTRELADRVFRQESPVNVVAAELGLSEAEAKTRLDDARETLSVHLSAWQ